MSATKTTTDRIVYVLVTEPGGVDGRDFEDKGGDVRAASYDKGVLEHYPNRPWCRLEARVVNIEDARRSALHKLDPIDKLVLELEGVKP